MTQAPVETPVGAASGNRPGTPALEVENVTVSCGAHCQPLGTSASASLSLTRLAFSGGTAPASRPSSEGSQGFSRVRGRIALHGREIVGDPAWKRARSGIALVPQGRGLLPSMSVEENLRLAELEHAGDGPAFLTYTNSFQPHPQARETARRPVLRR